MTAILAFSVIVPTRHRNDLLAKCLDHLVPSAQTLPSEQYEVIVTDDGDLSTAEQLVRHYYRVTKWVKGPCKGPAANRNNGAKHARGKWLVFCDDDCIPDKQWLEAYAEAIRKNPSYSVFEGRIYTNRPRRSLAEAAPVSETGGYLWSANFACRKDVFESLGAVPICCDGGCRAKIKNYTRGLRVPLR
jgi:glycosyltransferase involved in cell wall biosynthesis